MQSLHPDAVRNIAEDWRVVLFVTADVDQGWLKDGKLLRYQLRPWLFDNDVYECPIKRAPALCWSGYKYKGHKAAIASWNETDIARTEFGGAGGKHMVCGLTLELSGRCRRECQDTATYRSGPLERGKKRLLQLGGQAARHRGAMIVMGIDNQTRGEVST